MPKTSSKHHLTLTPRQFVSPSSSLNLFADLLTKHHIIKSPSNRNYAVAIFRLNSFITHTKKYSSTTQNNILKEFTDRIEKELDIPARLVVSTEGVAYILLTELKSSTHCNLIINRIRNTMSPYFATGAGYLNFKVSVGYAQSKVTTNVVTEVLKLALDRLNRHQA